MPVIHLSPSAREMNLTVSSGPEEYWMNRLINTMVPYLNSSGIRFTRNTPEITSGASILALSGGNDELRLILHANVSPERQGGSRGILVLYCRESYQEKQAAGVFSDNLKRLYPLPHEVRAEPTVLADGAGKSRAPSIHLELGYFDNPDDAAWLQNNLELIARNLVLSLSQYFGTPFLEPRPLRQAVVDVNWGKLNLRSRPDQTAPVLASACDGTGLTVINQWQNWHLVRFNNVVGYASADSLTLV